MIKYDFSLHLDNLWEYYRLMISNTWSQNGGCDTCEGERGCTREAKLETIIRVKNVGDHVNCSQWRQRRHIVDQKCHRSLKVMSEIGRCTFYYLFLCHFFSWKEWRKKPISLSSAKVEWKRELCCFSKSMETRTWMTSCCSSSNHPTVIWRLF